MKIAKWGNSLAIRIPAEVVETLGLKEGDDIAIRAAAGDHLVLHKTRNPKELWAEVRKLRGLIPADYKFRREDAYED
jgi:antitoxin MazE